MHVYVLDANIQLEESKKRDFNQRVLFVLARFGFRIERVTIRVRQRPGFRFRRFNCSIDVELQGGGTVSIRRTSKSVDSAFSAALAGIEPKVAFRVDWRSWINVDSVSTWLVPMTQPAPQESASQAPRSNW